MKSQSAVKRPRGSPKGVVRDPKKDLYFRELSTLLGTHGLMVRREKLKAGHGWKVVSGSCVAQGQRLVFVDQRMTQDDQIRFLQSIAVDAGIDIAQLESERAAGSVGVV